MLGLGLKAKFLAIGHWPCHLVNVEPGPVDITDDKKTAAQITRKLCYRKDDRAMRPIHGALKIFGTP